MCCVLLSSSLLQTDSVLLVVPPAAVVCGPYPFCSRCLLLPVFLVQDMLVVTGRAAAAALGQEVLPFSGPELQQVLLWTTWYYQQALVSVAAMQVCLSYAGSQGARVSLATAAAGIRFVGQPHAHGIHHTGQHRLLG